jgi:hypothetical protein
MRKRNAQGVVHFGGAGEGRVEAHAVELAHYAERELARNAIGELPAGELAPGLAADMQREGRRDLLEELEGMVVGHRDPDVGPQRPELLADARGDRPDLRHVLPVFGLGEREELGRVRQHRTA